jgi:hypothetical protein
MANLPKEVFVNLSKQIAFGFLQHFFIENAEQFAQ